MSHGDKLSRQIPRARVLVEGLVIVVSILSALAADAWWDGRQDRVEEREALAALHADFAPMVVGLDGGAAYYRARAERIEFLLGLAGHSMEDFPLVAADSALRTLIDAPTFDPGEQTLDALIASGRIELIRSAELRQLLTRWRSRVLEIQDGELVARGFIRDTLVPFMSAQGVPLTRVYNAVYPERPQDVLSPEDAANVYYQVLSDTEFRSLMSYRLNWDLGTADEYARAATLVGRIVALLESELGY